jgi:hypothetical protein
MRDRLKIRFDKRIAAASPAASDQDADQRDNRQCSKENGSGAGAHQVNRRIDGLVACAGHARRNPMCQDV